MISPGLVQDGTRCGTGRVCITQQCINVDQITTLSCPVGSNGQTCSGSANGVMCRYSPHFYKISLQLLIRMHHTSTCTMCNELGT